MNHPVTPVNDGTKDPMKPRSNTIIPWLLVAAALTAVGLIYLLLAQRGQPNLSPGQWAVFAVAALALLLVAFAPSLVGRFRHQPPPLPLTPVDTRRLVAVALVGCVLAFVGAYKEMWWLMTLGIMLAPFSFLPRAPRTGTGR